MILALGRLYTPPIRPEIANSWKIEDIIAPMDKIGRKIQNSTATKGGQGSGTLDHGGHGGSIVYLPISPASPPRVSVASFYPALVSHSCVARASVSQCLNVSAEETHCELRALLRILYPIPDATSCKLQLNTFILWKAHCAMRVAANIVLLKCHAALHEHQKMLELSWSVVVLIH